ncbi:hypothetical protein GGX14DRAFT_388546 [Mycena pura]|uniref:Uncharacterized protein n=1 Tax=Mycena pura TaxID=153505 RepID=A0AAD6VV65_9AGAR|nr:hypothetical protein GGX14DRAFT_388546 [Mycena pura]
MVWPLSKLAESCGKIMGREMVTDPERYPDRNVVLGLRVPKTRLTEKTPQWTGGLHEWQEGVITWIHGTGDGKSVPILLLELAKNPDLYREFGSMVGDQSGSDDQKSSWTPVGLALGIPALACKRDAIADARKIVGLL